MRRIAAISLAALGLLVWGSLAGAGTYVSLDASQGPASGEEAVQVQVSEGAGGAILLQYDLAGFEMQPVTVQGAEYQAITLGGESRVLEAGVPELPKICRSVIIPDQSQMEVRVISASYQDFTGIDVVPSKGNILRTIDPSTVAYLFGPAYEEDAWYPAEIAFQSDPYIMRDYRGLVVEICPMQYHPGTHTLRVYDEISIEVVPVGAGTVNTIDRIGLPTAVTAEFLQMYQDHFVNFGMDRYNPIPEVGEMLVICYDDWVAELQPLVAWKNQMGVAATLIPKSDVGTTYSQFQSYIQDYYNTHDLAHVLLIGDYAQIPSPSNGGAPADPIYALVAGADNYPDIFVGRFSAENPSQVALQVQKTVEYESMPEVSGHWYRRGVGIGSGEGAGYGDDGEADWQHIDNIRTDLLNFTFTGVDTIYAHYPYQATAQMVADAVNDGRSIINYCGHGWTQGWSTTGFSNTHVAQLTNYDMLPWIVSVACVNGAFQSGTCFAESWLRATRDGRPTGAVGMYASTVNMSWAPPMAAQDETVDLLVAQEKRTFGALCFSGSCQMMDEYGSGGISEFKNWHIFGDPSLRVRTAAPAAMIVEHEEFIDPDAASFTVTVPGISGALCGLSYQGEYYGSDFTDNSGVAEIEVVRTLPEEGPMTLTVTYFNKIPYIAEIEIGEQLIPTLLYDPLEFVFDMPLDAIEIDYLSITNTGMEGSVLEYQIRVQTGTPQMWLSVDPGEGECEFEETDVLEVTCDTHGLHIGIYQANILLITNAGPAAVIPVTLYSGGYAGVEGRGTPTALSLQAAGPNPFAGDTRVSLGLPRAGTVDLAVYDMSGRLVRTLHSGAMDPGFHDLVWDGRNEAAQRVAAGVYFYRMNIGGQTLTDKVMKLR